MGDYSEPQEQPGSVWAYLKRQHQPLTEERDPLYLDDPVHDGVVYRYRYVPLENTRNAQKRIAKMRDPIEQAIAGAADTLILALDEIMVTAPDGIVPIGDDGESLYSRPLKPLADPGQPPIRFDEVLCNGMGFPAKVASHARNIVREMFVHNDYLLIAHAQEVSAWIAEVGAVVRDEFSEALGKA